MPVETSSVIIERFLSLVASSAPLEKSINTEPEVVPLALTFGTFSDSFF